MPKLVEGYNMLIWELEDGSVTYTGSFNASEWADYTAKSKKEVSGATTVPDPSDTGSSTDADLVEQPAGNASAEEWRAYALTHGATEDEVADLSRNELRDQYRSEE
jgi:hypothetical protein